MMSYFGRLNYDYKQRYLVEGNLRYDGSSKFRPENRWQFFWGVSGGWRLSEESFMQPLSSLVSNLKLRLSYGVLGNQSGVDRYDGTQLYNFSSSSGAYIGSGKVSTIDTNGKIVTTDRTWERIHSYNLGLDFGFFNNRLTGTVELFMKKNNNDLQHVCSFCKRNITIRSQYDMPIYDPQTGFAICKNCIKDIYGYIVEHDKRDEKSQNRKFVNSLDDILAKNKPHVIKEFLDQYIINQDRAKKILSVAVYNHYKRMKYGYTHDKRDMNIEKSNVIMLGPSGCGKTAMLQHLSKLLDIPFAVTDASSLTEAGFVGSDVEVAVRNLYYAADKNIEKAEHGIIYLDEFDKIARKSGANNSITADPGHEGVQQGLLKMMEGGVVEFTAQGQRKHPEAPTIKVDTTNILFIVGGGVYEGLP